MWDAYDGQGNKTGGELIRGQEIPEGTRRRWYCRRGKLSFLWITAREFLEFVESEKHVWTQRERMEGYLDGVRNEEDNDCDFLYREF